MPNPLKDLTPHHFAQFNSRGTRVEDVTFYARTQAGADKKALAWAGSRGNTVKRIRRK